MSICGGQGEAAPFKEKVWPRGGTAQCLTIKSESGKEERIKILELRLSEF